MLVYLCWLSVLVKLVLLKSEKELRHKVLLDLPEPWYFYDMRRPINEDNETIEELIERSKYLRAAYWLFEGGDV